MPALKKNSFLNILKNIFKTIAYLILLYISLGIITLIVTPKDAPIDLGNGFICAEHPGRENNTRMLTNKKGDVLMQGNIQGYIVSDKTVYGSREDSSYDILKDSTRSELEKISFMRNGSYLYFICSFGEDCSNTQNYHKAELQKELAKRNLPPFIPESITNPTLIVAGIKNFFSFGVPHDFKVNADTIK